MGHKYLILFVAVRHMEMFLMMQWDTQRGVTNRYMCASLHF